MLFHLLEAGFLTALQLFIFWRIASVPICRRRVCRMGLAGLGAILWAAFIGAWFFGHGSTSAPVALLEAVGMAWMGTLLLLAVGMFPAEAITGGGLLLKRQAPVLRACGLAAGLLMAAIALVQGTRAPVVSEYEITLPDLPHRLDGMVVVALSDLHLGTQLGSGWLQARVRQIESLHPDLVLLAGDVIDGRGGADTDSLRTLTAPLGVWGVTGNHEVWGGAAATQALVDGGVRLLWDTWTEIVPGLVLAGVADTGSNRVPADGAGSVGRAVADRPPGAVILLSHKPRQTAEAAAAGVGLMLCGHTHNGQLWPFNYLKRLSFRYVTGLHRIGDMSLLVCRGTGTWGPRMRLWQRGEILRITLRAPR